MPESKIQLTEELRQRARERRVAKLVETGATPATHENPSDGGSRMTESCSMRGEKDRRSTVGSAATQNAANNARRNAKERLGNELAKMGQSPSGPSYEGTWPEQILAHHINGAEARPMLGLVAHAASYLFCVVA